jgi:hypothetical protein
MNAWGVVRGAKDVNIVVALDPENLKRLAEVAVGAHGHVQKGEAFLSTPLSMASRNMQSYVSPLSTPKSSASRSPSAQLTL